MLKTIERKKILPILGVIASLAVLAIVVNGYKKEIKDLQQKNNQQEISEDLYSTEGLERFQISKGQGFSDLLNKIGLDVAQASSITEEARSHIDYRLLRPAQQYFVKRNPDSSVAWIRFNKSEVEYVIIEPAEQTWKVKTIKDPVTVRLLNFSGSVEGSLWNSALEANMDPSLISELTEIFAWQVDFAREVRVGDSWRLTVEQRMVGDRQVGWGRIVAAEYKNQETFYSAVLFRKDGDDLGYYTPSGESLRRMFLKSPVRFSRISSRFSRRRFHPVLKTYRAHLGVDYAAPTGTPIRAVGEGVISFARRTAGGGNTLKLRHNSVYQTHYKHLHGFAKGIREGRQVKQGQVIGYVGSTGLSTGPHLHFEFYENGRYVDPLNKKFPSADPVPASLLTEFQVKSDLLLASLPAWDNAERAPAGGFEVVSREMTDRLNREVLEN